MHLILDDLRYIEVLWFQIPCCQCHLGTTCGITIVIFIIYLTTLISKHDVYHMYETPQARRHCKNVTGKIKHHGDKTMLLGYATSIDTCLRHQTAIRGNKGLMSFRKYSRGVHVILNAKFRFGSSFVGEMFARHSKFAYYFEPLYETIASGFQRSDSNIIGILKKLFNCSLTSMGVDNGSKNRANWKRVVLRGLSLNVGRYHAEVMTWKHVPHCWPFVRGMDSHHTGPVMRGFDFFCYPE